MAKQLDRARPVPVRAANASAQWVTERASMAVATMEGT
jgi:hypothetical protein